MAVWSNISLPIGTAVANSTAKAISNFSDVPGIASTAVNAASQAGSAAASAMLDSGAAGDFLSWLQNMFYSPASQLAAARETNAFNAQQAAINRQFNADEAEKARQFNAEQAAINRLFQQNSADRAMNFEANEAALLRSWQEAQNQKAMDYNTEMSNTAYQRAVKDLQAAGLNPILAYTNGAASTPSGYTSSGIAASGKAASGSAASGSAASGSAASGVQANVRGYINELTSAFSDVLGSAAKLVDSIMPF